MSSLNIDAAITAIESAAYEPALWDEALNAVAAATGSLTAQLCAIGESDAMSFNRLPGLPPEFVSEWAAKGYDHPAVNSRVRIGVQAPLLHSLDERAFQTEQDAIDCPDYGDMIDRFDVPYICLSNLLRASDAHVGFAILRTRRQGNVEGEERRAFDHLARHAQRAVRTSRLIGQREASAIARGMDAIAAAVFVCDMQGSVIAMTRRAEDILSGSASFLLSGGRLLDRCGGRDLSRLAAITARDRQQVIAPVAIVDNDGRRPLIVEFAPLPADSIGFPGAPGAVITIRRPWSHVERRIERQAMPMYGLTLREADVAVKLCMGHAPQAIANDLGLGLGTVRTHIRRLFDKTGAANLAQLVAILSAYDD